MTPDPKNLLPICLFFFLSMGQYQGTAQSTFQSLAGDTIVLHREFMGTGYFLDGKRLNLAVMDWFMADYPDAREQIRLAVVSDQLSTTGYAVGGIFVISGFLVRNDDLNLSNDLFKLSALSGGAALVFQLIEGTFKKNAVRKYNLGVQEHHRTKVGLRMGIQGTGIGMAWQF